MYNYEDDEAETVAYDLWKRVENIDGDKLAEEIGEINTIKKKIEELKRGRDDEKLGKSTRENVKEYEKQIEKIRDNSDEIKELFKILNSGNSFLLEKWDLDDPLLGAYSANEFIDLDFADEIEKTFNDKDLETFVEETSEEAISIKGWIDQLPKTAEKIKKPPPNIKGQILKRVKTLARYEFNPFRIKRSSLLNEIELSLEDTLIPNERIKRFTASDPDKIIKDKINYLLNYIKARTDKALPWAICGVHVGFVACPASYKPVLFNIQDGYYNASYISPKGIENWLKTMEGKMMVSNFSERYNYKCKPIPGVYRISGNIMSIIADIFILKGFKCRTFGGIYLHPELFRSFVKYLGSKTYNWVMPNMRYLMFNPARFMNGDSWYSKPLGSVLPKQKAHIKPLDKHLAFWLRTNESPLLIHVSFGDKWYLKKVLTEQNVLLISEFYGILDDDYQNIENLLNEKAKKMKYKTWKFDKWSDLKNVVAEIYINIDRAYYDYDSLRDLHLKIENEILYTKEKACDYSEAFNRGVFPPVIADVRESQFEHDFIVGEISDYIVSEEDTTGDVTYLDDGVNLYERAEMAPKVYTFGDVEIQTEKEDLDYIPPRLEIKLLECEEQDLAIEDYNNFIASGGDLSGEPPIATSSLIERSEPSSETNRNKSSRSSLMVAASEYGNPLEIRQKRKLLLRMVVVNYLINEYRDKHNMMQQRYKDLNSSPQERKRALRDYFKVYKNKNHEKEFIKKVLNAFDDDSSDNKMVLRRNIPVE